MADKTNCHRPIAGHKNIAEDEVKSRKRMIVDHQIIVENRGSNKNPDDRRSSNYFEYNAGNDPQIARRCNMPVRN